MASATHKKKVRQFQKLVEHGREIKGTDPEGALTAFLQAQEIFPTAEGLDKWLTYLRALVKKQQERKAKRADAEKLTETPAKMQGRFQKEEEVQGFTSEEMSASETTSEKQASAEVGRSSMETASAPQDQARKTPSQATKHEPDQDQVKEWVREAEAAAKAGETDKAVALFEQALQEIRDFEGPLKTRLKLLERRNKVKASPDTLHEAATIFQGQGATSHALKRLESAVRLDAQHIPSLQMMVELARESGQTHQYLTRLMQLSDAYEHAQNFQAFDELQKEIRQVKASLH